MLAVSLNIAFVAITLAMILNVWRLAKGPDVPDRILALDTLYINTIALMTLLGIRYDTTIFFEAALIIALLGFVGTIALCRYLLRGNIIE
jgi:multicomponent K+:H+ antiporter subunit F